MRRRHRRLRSEPDLDITPFMNLMIVLVPVLLLNMVFAHTRVLELNFPTGDGLSETDKASLQIQVVIFDDRLVVADNRGGVIEEIPQRASGQDFARLQEVMKALKARLPEKRDLVILPSRQTNYQTLVTVMDTVRAYDAVVAGSLVKAELFPDISLGDAPEPADGLGAAEGQS
ncbi:biopolymer transporter ExbD [Marinobacter lutaoensis]|uniref:Biopolymer transporter ExbD n=1 Tax=Marinobacter lutaoensis TaxID=135739 RepID=A0A1V2DYD1_9GAMM|nr:biopolymer transporter ExbD [Marinobacter lutaoensis]ONF45301.1 biopolymer transporter ExbD [Marinobacter lutaoensis]